MRNSSSIAILSYVLNPIDSTAQVIHSIYVRDAYREFMYMRDKYGLDPRMHARTSFWLSSSSIQILVVRVTSWPADQPADAGEPPAASAGWHR